MRFEESKSRVLDAKRRSSTFGARIRETNLRPNGAARVGYLTPNEKDRLLELAGAARVEIRHRTKTFDFWSSQARGEREPYGGRSRWGPDE